MPTTPNRREFLLASAGAAIAAAAPRGLGQVPAGATDKSRPAPPGGIVAIASANGLSACSRAVADTASGAALLDAIVAGINLVEDDPNDQSVGLGGLPNEDGVVELDASVMDGATHKAGAVAALRNIRNPSSVALRVLRRTDHVLIVGEGALRFARAHGFKEEELLTDASRATWLRWKESHSDKDDWFSPETANSPAGAAGTRTFEFTYGTISCLARDAVGDLAGCTSTSGLSYKIPGRVGDSPVIGAGLYVDNEVGACGSTGRGEANLINCSSVLVVEAMRAGATPEGACLQVLQRIATRAEPRLKNERGEAAFQLKLYALRKDGVWGGATMRKGGQLAVHDALGPRLVAIPSLFQAE